MATVRAKVHSVRQLPGTLSEPDTGIWIITYHLIGDDVPNTPDPIQCIRVGPIRRVDNPLDAFWDALGIGPAYVWE